MKKFTLLAVLAFAAAGCQPASEESDSSQPIERDILPADAAPISYEIVIKPDIAAKTFAGEARLTFTVKKSADRIVVNGINLTVASAVLDDATPAEVEINAESETIAFLFKKKLSKGEHHLNVEYAGRIYDNAAGLFISTYPTPEGKKSLIASQMEPGDARKLAPMWDEPALKAVFKMAAVLPEGMVAVSNMPVEKTTPAGDGLMRVDFAPTPKMSSYLLYFSAGDFERITRDYNGVELGVVTRSGESEKGRYALNATADILDYYYDYFDVAYPLPKLDEIAAPGAAGFGAMENWGAIFYFEPALLLDPRFSTPRNKQRIFGVVAHEVAHQWFGDLVTMEWWDDLWLNESFASWMDAKISDHLNPDWRVWLQSLNDKERAFRLDSMSSTHPVSQRVRNIAEATIAFDAITYQKGQMVIRMIEDYVGEEAFRNGVRSYMKEHAYGNAKTADLWRAIDAASDAPVMDIAQDFTLQPGIPMIVVDSAACDEAGDITTLSVRQIRYGADAESKANPLVWRTPVKASVVGSEKIARATIAGPDPQTMSLPGCGAAKVNAGESGYFRTLYADALFAALANSYDALGAEDRLGLLNDAYALGESGDAPFSRFLELAAKTPETGEPVILRSLAGKLVGLNELFRNERGADLFSAFALKWLKPAFETIGWDAKAGEAENAAILRSSLIGALADFNDADVIAEARRRFAAYQNDPSSLSPAILSAVIEIVAAKADEATFDQLLAAARNADNPREQRLYYSALGDVEDETLAQRAIGIFLSDEVSPQLRPRYFRSLAGHHPRLIWNYYVAHFEEIEADLDPLERLEYGPGVAAAAGDEKIADELEAFAKEHLPDSAKIAVDRAVQRIRFRAAVKRDQLPELAAWLEARGESPATP